MTVGERIKQRRLDLHLTQEELAKRLHYKGKSAISRVEKEGDNVTTDRIERFAKALECTPGYLMGWTENPNQLSIFDIIDKNGNVIEIANNTRNIYEKSQSLSDEEYVIVACYRDMDIKQKEMLKRMLAYAEKFKELYGKDVSES